MKRKLYSNMKRMTSLFCVAIVCVTLTTLLLRLTVFSDLAVTVLAAPDETSLALPGEESSLFPYTISRKVAFENAHSPGDFQIHNPDTNEFYMTVTVIRPETGENLLYTGFTRAKSLLIVAGSRTEVAAMVRNNRRTLRYTNLRAMLEEQCTQPL